jgi:hypothetical protein
MRRKPGSKIRAKVFVRTIANTTAGNANTNSCAQLRQHPNLAHEQCPYRPQ